MLTGANVMPVRQNDYALTKEDIEDYLSWLESKDRAQATVESYRRNLYMVYNNLPDDKTIRQDTIEKLRETLLSSNYAPQTINGCMSVLRGFLQNTGNGNIIVPERFDIDQTLLPEITRAEYLRLLSTAKILGKQKEYLLIKIFGTLGINVSDLPLVTYEAVEKRKIECKDEVLTIPECLRKELLDYSKSCGIIRGPIFVYRSGEAFSRTMVTHWTQSIAEEARVSKDKANPRCLRKLYQATQENIKKTLALIQEKTYEQMLETEQITIGWE